MEQSQSAGSGRMTSAALLTPFVRRLLGVTVFRLWRMATVSDDGTIPLLGTMVLEADTGFVTLSYTQDGLSCAGPVRREEIRWDTEPDLVIGRVGAAEEWLDLAHLEDEPNPVSLPVRAVTGWFGVGPYTDTFALILTGDRELVIMTTDEFDLRLATREEARRRAELVAANMDLRLTELEERL